MPSKPKDTRTVIAPRALGYSRGPTRRHFCGAQASIEVKVIDLSAAGGQVVASQSLGDKDAVFALVLTIGQRDDGQAIELAVSARIKVVKPLAGTEEAAPRWTYGVQFEGLNEQSQLRLENFVLKRLNDQPNGIV